MPQPIRIGINGFGRIGRAACRQLLADGRFEVAGINDLSDLDDLAYLMRYDSVHGTFHEPVDADGTATLVVGDRRIPFSNASDPADIPWGELGATLVIESTGAFRSRADAARHLDAGARRVVISAPSDDADATFVHGVNHRDYDPERHRVVSSASCTTNCLAPVAMVLHDRFGIEDLLMSTIHAYTSSQALVDRPARKRRRGRAGALSIVPTTTGAAKATEVVLPALAGRMDGMAYRVPVEDGSVIDAVAHLERDVTADDVLAAFEEAAAGELRGDLRVSRDAIVSRDVIGDPHGAIVDAAATMVLRDRVAKVVAWYDNEWGYAARMLALAHHVASAD